VKNNWSKENGKADMSYLMQRNNQSSSLQGIHSSRYSEIRIPGRKKDSEWEKKNKLHMDNGMLDRD
jgi:hypothetical protein